MARNHIQPGVVADYANATGSTILSGAVVVMGARIGVALVDIPDGQTGSVQVKEVFSLPKKATDVIGQGDLVYWDATPGEITTTATDNTLAGYAFAAAADGATDVRVDLNG
jgi:predicted RecA/RadA family phage recombinase